MPIPNVGVLNEANITRLAKALQQDDVSKRQAINQIGRSLFTFMDTAFKLTPRQRRQIRQMPQALAETLKHGCILALRYGGTVKLQPVRAAKAALRLAPDKVEVKVEGGTKGDVPEVKVTVTATWNC